MLCANIQLPCPTFFARNLSLGQCCILNCQVGASRKNKLDWTPELLLGVGMFSSQATCVYFVYFIYFQLSICFCSALAWILDSRAAYMNLPCTRFFLTGIAGVQSWTITSDFKICSLHALAIGLETIASSCLSLVPQLAKSILKTVSKWASLVDCCRADCSFRRAKGVPLSLDHNYPELWWTKLCIFLQRPTFDSQSEKGHPMAVHLVLVFCRSPQRLRTSNESNHWFSY